MGDVMLVARGETTGASPDETAGQREPLWWLPVLLLVAAIALIGVWSVRRTTWYLAIDQFGYLTFARDLASGRATHDWSLLPALQSLLPATDVDVYAQTYVRRGDALYCRYAPGFPAILAAARVAFGPAAEHLVNPIMLGLLLWLMFMVARRLWRSAWIGLGCALLTALLPNYVLLWSTSPLRDVPAHLIALSGLYLLVPGGRRLGVGSRTLLAGLLLGYAVTTRIDAALYLLAAAGLGVLDRARLVRRVVLGALGFVVGIAPLLAYNSIATGNPLRPTQAMEIESVLSRATSAPRWLASVLASPEIAHAEEAAARAADGTDGATRTVPAPSPTPFSVQGGGLRLSNFMRTMPANAKTVREAMGDLVLLLAAIGGVAALRRPALFLLVVPYVVVAFVFFSMWTLPGPRYLTGVLLLLPLLAVEGACSLPKLVALLVPRTGRVVGMLVTIVLAGALIAATLRVLPGQPSALPWVERAFAAAIVAGCLAAGVSRERLRHQVALALVFGLTLAAIFAWRSSSSLDRRASFQRAQVARARATIEGVTDYPAVILTSTQIGRPAENINYYTNVEAVYLEELVRWQAQPRFAVAALLKAGFAVYLLLPPQQAKQWLANSNIADWYEAETVRSIAPRDAEEFFVASPYHTGIALDLVRLDLKRPAR